MNVDANNTRLTPDLVRQALSDLAPEQQPIWCAMHSVQFAGWRKDFPEQIGICDVSAILDDRHDQTAVEFLDISPAPLPAKQPVVLASVFNLAVPA